MAEMHEVFGGNLDQSGTPTLKVLILNSGGHPVTGLTFSDVTLNYMRAPDTVLNAFALSGSNFIEVGSGLYRVVLDATVLAHIGTLVLYFSGAGFKDFTYRYYVQAKNPGNVQVTITVETVAPTPLPDTQVDIWDSGLTSLLWSGVTDSSGEVVVALNPGSYKVLLRRTRTSFTVPETLAVTGPTPETQTYNGAEISVPASSNPNVCVIYGNIYDISGVPDDQVSPDYVAVHAQKTQGLIHTGGRFYTADKQVVKADANGYFEMELVQGIQVVIRIPRVGVDKTITVPALATVDLSTLV